MLQRISQSSVAWQQRHPRGHRDMMIEWLSQCEQEAEGIRKSRHTQVSHCGVSLEEKPAERPQQGTPLDGGPGPGRRAGLAETGLPGCWQRRGHAQGPHTPTAAPPTTCTSQLCPWKVHAACTRRPRLSRGHAHPSSLPNAGAGIWPSPGRSGDSVQILRCGWEVSAKPAFTLDASGFCVALSSALFILTATRGSTWSHFRFSFFRGSLGLQQPEWDVLRPPVPSVPHARLPG